MIIPISRESQDQDTSCKVLKTDLMYSECQGVLTILLLCFDTGNITY